MEIPNWSQSKEKVRMKKLHFSLRVITWMMIVCLFWGMCVLWNVSAWLSIDSTMHREDFVRDHVLLSLEGERNWLTDNPFVFNWMKRRKLITCIRFTPHTVLDHDLYLKRREKERLFEISIPLSQLMPPPFPALVSCVLQYLAIHPCVSVWICLLFSLLVYLKGRDEFGEENEVS